MDAQFRRQELERFQDDFPPMFATEDKVLEEVTSRTITRITELLGRELREIPEQDWLTASVRRLFCLPQPPMALPM